MLNKKVVFIALIMLFCIILSSCANVGKEETSETSRVRPYGGNVSRETSVESGASLEDTSESIIEGVVSRVSDAVRDAFGKN